MALYRVTIFKRLEALNGEQWTNVYHVDALGAASALDAGETIANLEANVLIQAVTIFRISVKELPDGATALRAVTIAGDIDIDPANMIPMFNTIRCTFTDDVGRSESKYLRGRIGEINVQGFNISGELRDEVNTLYAQEILGVLGIRGPNGETLESASVQQLIQMRQLGWHRRTRPGFKRGWVPV